MLGLAGGDPEAAKVSADSVLELETRMAAAHLTRVERRDPDLTYNKARHRATTPRLRATARIHCARSLCPPLSDTVAIVV